MVDRVNQNNGKYPEYLTTVRDDETPLVASTTGSPDLFPHDSRQCKFLRLARDGNMAITTLGYVIGVPYFLFKFDGLSLHEDSLNNAKAVGKTLLVTGISAIIFGKIYNNFCEQPPQPPEDGEPKMVPIRNPLTEKVPQDAPQLHFQYDPKKYYSDLRQYDKPIESVPFWEYVIPLAAGRRMLMEGAMGVYSWATPRVKDLAITTGRYIATAGAKTAYAAFGTGAMIIENISEGNVWQSYMEEVWGL